VSAHDELPSSWDHDGLECVKCISTPALEKTQMRLKILTERSSVPLWYDDQNAAAPVGLILSFLDRER
jgi:hypothetical protein